MRGVGARGAREAAALGQMVSLCGEFACGEGVRSEIVEEVTYHVVKN